MDKFVRNLLTEWRRLGLAAGGSIVVGVSGGADSMSLLAALADLVRRGKLGIGITAAHFDHRLRPESALDAAFVADYCGRMRIGCKVGSAEGELSIARSGNLEQNARIARYAFLSSVAIQKSAVAVFTAHTQNDQAETFLHNLIRGSGQSGLAAMAPVSEQFMPHAGGTAFKLVRPLLKWAGRSDCEQFCVASGIAFRTDPMNSDRRFARVRIREELLPILATFNPKIVETLARTARVIGTNLVGEPYSVEDNPRIMDLAGLSEDCRRSTIRSWLKLVRGHLRGIGLSQIEAVERLIMSRRSGRIVQLPGKGNVEKRNGRLTFIPDENHRADGL